MRVNNDMRNNLVWSAEMIQKMKNLFDMGLTAGDVAAELEKHFKGNRFTRNSVLGKNWRLKNPQEPKKYYQSRIDMLKQMFPRTTESKKRG